MSSSVSAVTHKQLFNTSTSHIDLVVNIDHSVDIDVDYEYFFFWFHNGKTRSLTYVSQFKKQAKLTITNPTILDSGVYETVIMFSTYGLLSSTCDDPLSYASQLLRFGSLVIGSDVQQSLYSGI